MKYAHVVLDIPTRALDAPFDYLIPENLENECKIGSTVSVKFNNRPCIGYVIDIKNSINSDIDNLKIKAVDSVLADSAFDENRAKLAQWISLEYAAPLSLSVRLFLPPGQSISFKQDDDKVWQLICDTISPTQDFTVYLDASKIDFEPKKNAVKQREIIDALKEGPIRLSELVATIPGARSTVNTLEKKGILHTAAFAAVRGDISTTLSSANAKRPSELTEGQERALSEIDKAMRSQMGDVVVVDGVTGSGKTEVYLEAIEHALSAGKGAIVLVPEISLTAQTVGRFRNRFGNRVAILHSKLSQGERRDEWEQIRLGIAQVVVGARSALFAPVKNIGIIVIDEEHEFSYKQDSAPRYHAREVASKLAKLSGAALVLGSATPSIESLYRCNNKSYRGSMWTRCSMPERPSVAELPSVEIVDMRSQFKASNNSPFSVPLALAINDNIKQGKKSVLLLNRRGFANYLMCRECGSIPTCPHCSTSLTYHERTHELVCHTCGQRWPQIAYPNPSTSCPNCGSKFLAAYGVGTQRVEDELALLVGDSAPIIRMDADSTKTKGAHQKLLEEFDEKDGAILIGTQMIAKGLDFPEVTLVGVINADTTLKLPDFRAPERTYDLLEQVAGRAGRGKDAGRVIIQTYWPNHPAIEAVKAHNRDAFVECEYEERKETYYPPFSRLSNITVSSTNEALANSVVEQIAARLREYANNNSEWRISGPAVCLKAKVKDRFRFHVTIKSPLDFNNVGSVLADICRQVDTRYTSVAIDVDAYDML